MRINISSPEILTDSRGNREVRLAISEPGIGTSDLRIGITDLLDRDAGTSRKPYDFLFIAACIYGTDRFVNRKRYSVDGWSRELEVCFPVSEIDFWNSQRDQLDTMLSFLTGDYWKVSFVSSSFQLPIAQRVDGAPISFSYVSLFSGGLDSLIGAIDSLERDQNTAILTVSHYDPKIKGPLGDQETLRRLMTNLYGNRFQFVPSVPVYSDRLPSPNETTLRSRSIVFLAIALCIAEPRNLNIVVPENGTVSLNYPLSSSRRGACSTRTTHPTFLKAVGRLFTDLGFRGTISNPYEFATKQEMVQNCLSTTNLASLVGSSNSCGKRGHRRHWDANRSATHCGICMPCVYRRVSLLNTRDQTSYGCYLSSLPPFVEKRGRDIGACLEFLRRPLSDEAIRQELIANGLHVTDQINEYVSVVKRTRLELKDWVARVNIPAFRTKAGV